MLTPEQVEAQMRKFIPHGPDEPCTCNGADCQCDGYVVGCTCDCDWERAFELHRDYM